MSNLVESVPAAERCHLCRKAIFDDASCVKCAQERAFSGLLEQAVVTPMDETTVGACVGCGAQINTLETGHWLCMSCLSKRPFPHYHCNRCGAEILAYNAEVGINGYESQTFHLHHGTVGGYAGTRPVFERLCKECYRVDWADKYPELAAKAKARNAQTTNAQA